MFDLLLLMFNGAIAAVIFVRLVFVHSAPTQSSAAHGRLVRYVIAVVYGVIAARSFLGWYFTPVEPSEVAVNALVLWQVWLVQGDMSLLVQAIRTLRSKGESEQ